MAEESNKVLLSGENIQLEENHFWQSSTLAFNPSHKYIGSHCSANQQQNWRYVAAELIATKNQFNIIFNW